MKLISHSEIHEVKILTPNQHKDNRGTFVETWNEYAVVDCDGVQKAITDTEIGPFVQDNHSISVHKNTIRGLHAQKHPHAHGKLVRVIRGAIIDVAVDARKDSPTYGKWIAEILSANNWKQLWIPKGFLHGFRTIEPDTEVVYKLTTPYCKDAEVSVAWNSPDLNINWQPNHVGRLPKEIVISEKDSAATPFIRGQFFL